MRIMRLTCQGLCHRYKAEVPKTGGRYAAGQKWCVSCRIFMSCDGYDCPCCNFKLRQSARYPKNKEKLDQPKRI